MGIMQVAVETYDSLQEQYAGKIIQDHATMAPVSHILTSAQIEITLDQNGGFVDAVLLDKNEPKIVIPVTEESAGRTSSPCAHPLCEQLGYLTGLNEEKYRLYIDQLTKWAESSHSHMLLLSVLNYVKSGEILSDLLEHGVIRLDENGRPENEKMLVRWRMVLPDRTVESWKDSSLFQSFIEFYEENKRKGKQGICMLSGKQSSIALQHPKGIISINGNAKLISANDSSGFTYRGRFVNDEQALTISYDMSQKAHNALRWIAADQGVQVIYGGRTFLCWNPHGKEVRPPMAAFMLPSTLPSWKNATDYHNELKRILAGERAKFPETEKVIIAAFDAATTGRLALTYYNELEGSDYLQRLMEWDMHCCWYRGKFGIQPPLLIQIINNAFGVQRSEKNVPQMKADDRVVRQQMQRLISCRIDSGRIPADIKKALVDHASFPQAYDEKVWRKIVYTTCAVLNKYYYDRNVAKGGEEAMGWKLNEPDRSFQFGRLLAAMEKIEQDYYYQAGEKGEDGKTRMTTAIKSLSNYRQRPFTVYERVREHLWQAYIPRVNQASRIRFEKLVGEIMAILSQVTNDKNELNKPLDDIYLLGYDLQRNAFFKSVQPETASEEGMTETY